MATTLAKKVEYSLDEIDQHLGFISNIILHGKRTVRSEAFAKADEWLDMRLKLTEGGENEQA